MMDWSGYTETIYHPKGPESVGLKRIHTPSRTSYGGGGGVDPAALEAINKAAAYYQPGGGFGKGVEAGIERGRTKAVASGTQALVSAGLFGTTMPAGLSKKYEEEVAMPARERVEETRAERLSGLETMKAQIIQGATEASRSRALQQYLAKLQSGTSLALGSMGGRQRTIVAPSKPTQATTQQKVTGPQRHTGSYPSPLDRPTSNYQTPQFETLAPATPDMYSPIHPDSFDVGKWFGPGGWLTSDPQKGPGGYPMLGQSGGY